jgi:hypothetical protein
MLPEAHTRLHTGNHPTLNPDSIIVASSYFTLFIPTDHTYIHIKQYIFITISGKYHNDTGNLTAVYYLGFFY